MWIIEWVKQMVKDTLAYFSTAEPEPEDTSLVGQCEKLYRDFPFERLADYHQNKGIGVSVNALYHNIGKTTDMVNQHLSAMEIHGNPLPEMCRYETETVRFNKFILSKEGNYQPLQGAMLEMRDAVLRLCAKIRSGDTPESITHPYTMRLLTPLLKHLVEIIVIVEEVNGR